ncbi:MAG: glycoside hydrolase family 3 C-terminal domain-containing protein [Eubacteriales bacterium]|nr:glycoside hydrolase family 3 C-terminal domain-containing protein [Eubacteriales bacterium]
MENKYIINWDKYAQLARMAAAEGAVLLQNENEALPFRKNDRISVFGRIQFDYYKSGTGSGGMVNTRYVVGILDALKEETEISLNKELEQAYRDWIAAHPYDYGSGWAQDPWSQEEMPLEMSAAEQAAAVSDAALVIIGRTAGEDRDAENAPGSYLLTEAEKDMLAKVRSAFDRVIVLLNVGNIIDMSWVEVYHPDAVLYTWQGGMEGGHAAADVLMGRVVPCGKLSDTIAKSIEDYPSTAYFGGENGDFYAEDIYVGYRYFETFAKDRVLYPFGYGLSYTTFEVECTGAEYTADTCVFRVRVKNTGKYAGKETVQIYVKAPLGALGKPARSLAAFAKTRSLQPGEEQELELEVQDYLFASYDDSGVTGHKSCYVLEAGTYEFYIGTDVRSAALAGSFEAEEVMILEQCTEALAPVEAFRRMKPEEDAEGKVLLSWEDTPLCTCSMAERMNAQKVPEIAYTGNRGYVLGDVYDGTISMEEFLAQMSAEDLCCIVRGEGMCSPKVTPGTAAAFGGVSESLKKLGIPCGCCADGPSGIRMDCGTYAFSLPNGTCLACSFNEALIEELYQMEGAELRKNRIDTLLGPGMNIHRNPLNGRNFEYFSEDPLLTGRMASAQLRGMNAYGVTGTIKHFAANNQEHHRSEYNSVVSERALREIYLKGFEIAVKEGGAYSVMTTYGAINGLWTAGNYDLLTTILRGEWKYDGMVMTDWWAKMNEEGKPASGRNAAAMVRGQNDVYMVCQNPESNSNHDNLAESIENGTLTRGLLQRSAVNILKMLMRSPVMERSLGRMSREELDACESMAEDDKVDFDIEFHPIKDKLILDAKDVDTSKGKTQLYGIQAEKIGTYAICMKVKVDASGLSQVPVTIYSNGTIAGTVTLNGTNGEWIEIRQTLGRFVGPNNFIRLFFAQSGMQIDTITVELLEENFLKK